LIYYGTQLKSSSALAPIKWPKFLIIGNVLLSLLLGGFLFNEVAPSQSKIIEYTNEAGDQVETIVPSLHKIKTVACFQFENLTGNEKLDWWSIAFSHLLQLDLEQRPEFYVSSAYGLYGYYDPLGLPPLILPNVAMQREIAQKSRSDYFSRISYSMENDQYVFKGNLYNTRDGKAVLTIDVLEEDPYLAIDEIKQQIADNIPNAFKSVENQISLPVSGLLTGNQKALEYFTKSQLVYLKNPTGKLEEVLTLAKKAIELDPSCSICQYDVGGFSYGLGRRDEALLHLKNAIKYGASLPERMQFRAKEVLYTITDKMDAYFKLQEIHRKQFPYDFAAYQRLTEYYRSNYGIDSAKVLIYEAIDNGNIEKGLLTLYDLQLENEEYAAAEKTLSRLSNEFPDRAQDKIKYATIYEKQGRIKEAKAILLELETLDPLDTDIQINIAYLDFINSDINQAVERINLGLQQATTLTDSLYFLDSRYNFLKHSGQIGKALKAMKEYEKATLRQAPINRVIAYFLHTKTDMYQSIGRAEKVETLLAEVTKYSPESETLNRCMINTNALERQYTMQLNQEEYAACRETYQAFGDGYGEYFDVLLSYQSGDYNKCIKILDIDNGRVKKLFDDKYFLAKIYAKADAPQKAMEILQKVIDQKTDEPLYYYEMAALKAKEDKVIAKTYLDIALKYWANADANYIPLQRARALAEQLSK